MTCIQPLLKCIVYFVFQLFFLCLYETFWNLPMLSDKSFLVFKMGICFVFLCAIFSFFLFSPMHFDKKIKSRAYKTLRKTDLVSHWSCNYTKFNIFILILLFYLFIHLENTVKLDYVLPENYFIGSKNIHFWAILQDLRAYPLQ